MPDENNQVETTTTETPIDSGDRGGGEVTQQDTGQVQQPESSDWRVQRYGADYESNAEYWRDTTKYLRGELDKAKKASRRSIEEQDQPSRLPPAPTNGQPDPYADVRTVGDVFSKVEGMLSEREKQANFRASLRATREREQGDQASGIPSFAELEEEILVPLVKQNPTVLRLLKELPDPGQAAYTLAFLMKYKSVDSLRQLFAGEGREEMGKKINEVSKQAVRLKGSRPGQTSGKLTPEDIWSMPAEKFDQLVKKNTGRVP